MTIEMVPNIAWWGFFGAAFILLFFRKLEVDKLKKLLKIKETHIEALRNQLKDTKPQGSDPIVGLMEAALKGVKLPKGVEEVETPDPNEWADVIGADDNDPIN